MIKITTTEAKTTPSKKNIQLKGIRVNMLKLVDDEGVDVTQDVVDALPDGIEYVDFKITVELPAEEDSES